MTSKETILTAEGLAKLEAELEELRTVKRLERPSWKSFALSSAWKMRNGSMKRLLMAI